MTLRVLVPVAAFALTAAAEAAPPATPLACGDHATLVAALVERYREEPVSMGLQNDGNLLEVYASRTTGSWTILSTRTDGTSCILAVGKHYEQRRPGGDETDAAGKTETPRNTRPGWTEAARGGAFRPVRAPSVAVPPAL